MLKKSVGEGGGGGGGRVSIRFKNYFDCVVYFVFHFLFTRVKNIMILRLQ